MTPKPLQPSEQELQAAEHMDWQQVVLNGGPPCFHLEDGRFCGRAERWAGHGELHKFRPLHEILQSTRAKAPDGTLQTAEWFAKKLRLAEAKLSLVTRRNQRLRSSANLAEAFLAKLASRQPAKPEENKG